MRNRIAQAVTILLLAAVANTGFAKKPESHGLSGSTAPQAQSARHESGERDFFTDASRLLIRDYYADQRRAGHCPPGLAKKHNGCMPPGQAKKWHRGEYLPRDAVYYDLPAAVLDRLGRTRDGEKIIQLGTDILLVSVATGLILDTFGMLD